MSMVERVAQELYVQEYGPRFTTPWEQAEEPTRNFFRLSARAAIKAMREPTRGMEDAGRARGVVRAKAAWQAMIDAALSEGEI